MTTKEMESMDSLGAHGLLGKRDQSSPSSSDKEHPPQSKRREKDIQGKFWSARLTKSKVESLESLLSCMSKFEKYAFQEEIGEGGMEHYQMCFVTKGRSRRSGLRKLFMKAFPTLKFPSVDYLEKATSIEGCEAYSTKNDSRVAGPWVKGFKKPIKVLKPETLRSWQKKIYDQVADEKNRDGRSVFWYWESKGNIGKSYLSKCMIQNLGTLVIRGSDGDIVYGFRQVSEKRDIPSVVIDLPRDDGRRRFTFSAVEDLLNGYAFNTKYESGQVTYDPPMVIVFANKPPSHEDMQKMSRDRWKIVELNEV